MHADRIIKKSEFRPCNRSISRQQPARRPASHFLVTPGSRPPIAAAAQSACRLLLPCSCLLLLWLCRCAVLLLLLSALLELPEATMRAAPRRCPKARGDDGHRSTIFGRSALTCFKRQVSVPHQPPARFAPLARHPSSRTAPRSPRAHTLYGS